MTVYFRHGALSVRLFASATLMIPKVGKPLLLATEQLPLLQQQECRLARHLPLELLVCLRRLAVRVGSPLSPFLHAGAPTLRSRQPPQGGMRY